MSHQKVRSDKKNGIHSKIGPLWKSKIFVQSLWNLVKMIASFSPNFMRIGQKLWIFLLMVNFWACAVFSYTDFNRRMLSKVHNFLNKYFKKCDLEHYKWCHRDVQVTAKASMLTHDFRGKRGWQNVMMYLRTQLTGR